jgi:hypothetical protein
MRLRVNIEFSSGNRAKTRLNGFLEHFRQRRFFTLQTGLYPPLDPPSIGDWILMIGLINIERGSRELIGNPCVLQRCTQKLFLSNDGLKRPPFFPCGFRKAKRASKQLTITPMRTALETRCQLVLFSSACLTLQHSTLSLACLRIWSVCAWKPLAL